jgi:hypothetical protein
MLHRIVSASQGNRAREAENNWLQHKAFSALNSAPTVQASNLLTAA